MSAVLFLLFAFAAYAYAGSNKVVSTLTGTATARILLTVGTLMVAIEGTWSLQVHTSWPFVLYVLILLLSLSLTSFCRIAGIFHKVYSLNARNVGFILNHFGMFVIIWASFFGSPDVTRCKVMLHQGECTNLAVTQDLVSIPLPFSIALDRFEVEYYESQAAPRQFKSTLNIDGHKMTTEVNAPCNYKGYTIYQDGYDRRHGRYSVLLLVNDPWYFVVVCGIAMLALGSILLLFNRWNARVVIPVSLLLAAVFTVFSVMRINFSTLMPALRSWWFVPHLGMYMIAYSLTFVALILDLYYRVRRKPLIVAGCCMNATNLAKSACALIILGMLTGSIWARQAWGDYWAWDPKENWAAVTWFLMLVYLHVANKKRVWAFVCLLLSFIALQITWYGVNYLPSAINSLHTYTN